MKHRLKTGAAAIAILAASALSACTSVSTQNNSPALGAWGVDLAQADMTADPGDDFNRYVNGVWLDSTEIPADLARYGMFDQLRLDAEGDIRAIVEDLAAADAPEGSLEQKVGDFYASWMDQARLNALGTESLKPHFDKIDAIQSHADLPTAFASLHNTAPFSAGILPDPADTTRYVAGIGQDGLGMPDRDYYLKDDEKFRNYRTEYLSFIETMLTLAGVEEAATKAMRIFDLEMEIAKVHWTQTDIRDIQKIYNPMSPAELAEIAPAYDWPAILAEFGLENIQTIIVTHPSAIAEAGALFMQTPLDDVKAYLKFHFVRNHAAELSSDFDDAHFEFYDKTLRGAEEQRERWKRGVQAINAGLGEAVGQIYLDRHFPPSYKAEMDALVANLLAAFKERLEQNEWMDDETREQALLKLSTFEPRIGYTEKWTDYGPLSVASDTLLDNAIAITEFQWREQLDRLDGPVDREIWPYPPQTVNASYNPLLNQITFPAGILQPPFFDPYADPAVNYGGIGAVIGHEIGHGFDDQGRRFDELGRIRDWWTESANERFEQKTGNLGGQYDSYEPVEGLNINGELTMGENIGDLGGLQMAYAAYHRYLDSCCGGAAPVVDGLTGDQRFFLGWAQVWRAKAREDEVRRRLLTDPHSPPEYRVNGVVRNLDAWYDAFDVSEDDALYLAPEDRVRIW